MGKKNKKKEKNLNSREPNSYRVRGEKRSMMLAGGEWWIKRSMLEVAHWLTRNFAKLFSSWSV